MSLNQEALREHIETRLSAAPGVGALINIRSKYSPPINFNFGIQDETATFPIYSIAKTILAVLALDLSNQGRLGLDAEIGSYVQRKIPSWLRSVTLRNLLSHRSGIYDYGWFNSYHEAVKKSPGHVEGSEDFVSQVLDKGSQFEAGKSFFYSNVGYMLIREIIEARAGENIQNLFETKIGTPLKIRMKFLGEPSKDIMSGFSPYLSKDCPDVKGLYDFSWVFHGTFRAQLSDLTIFFENLESVIGVHALKEMASLYPLDFPHPLIRPSYGLGLMGDMNSSFGPVYGHNGGGPGFSVAAYVLPEKNVTVAAVINRDSSIEAEKLVFELLKSI